MTCLYFTESDVERLLTPRAVTNALEEAFRGLARGEAVQAPRLRVKHGAHVLHNLPCVSRALGLAGVKSYLSGPAGVSFATLVFELESCRLKAVVESNRLGQLRTGCATALACRYLAVPGPQVLALFGTGTVARGQLEALDDELDLQEVRIFSRARENRERFRRWAAERLGLEVLPAATVAEAAEGANLVVTATSAAQPFLESSMLPPECHVNAVGANWFRRREIGESVVRDSGRIVVDDREQAGLEAGELEGIDPQRLESLADLVSAHFGTAPSRHDRPPRTLFKSLGVAIEDLAAASLLIPPPLA
ncbi:MAG: ornithine cyclodeaminase family protein [Candidatus Eremiobacterota bacterium]